jgi:xylitol oxidase
MTIRTEPPPDTPTNWAGNLTYHAARWHRPATLAELQDVVARCRRLRALGTRHSFNTLADTDADLVSLERLAPHMAVAPDRRSVTVGAGVRYGDLCRFLHREGLSLHNLASLPHISVAGACATATHGSGDNHGSLATAVTALEMVTASGDVVALSRARDGHTFAGAVVALGALGVVTTLTLQVAPAFAVRQDVYEHLPLAALEAHFDELLSCAYSVSLFTDWRASGFNQVWVKRVVNPAEPFSPPADLFGATLARGPLHPIPGVSPVNCTEQLGVPGPWHERLPHFRLEFTPSSGEELQAEYLVPRPHAFAALRALDGLRDQLAPLVQITELRTVAADDLWLSPCYQQDCVCLHFTLVKDWPAVQRLLPVIEAVLAPFEPRPHWGKLFTLPPPLVQARYPRLPDFRRLLAHYDPEGKFRNAFVDAYVFGEH